METVKWLVLGTAIVWSVLDIWLDKKGKLTISKVILTWTGIFGVPLCFGLGFIAGHIFWPQVRAVFP